MTEGNGKEPIPEIVFHERTMISWKSGGNKSKQRWASSCGTSIPEVAAAMPPAVAAIHISRSPNKIEFLFIRLVI